MNIAFSKFCKEIKFNPNSSWERVFLLNANLKNNVFSLHFQTDDLIPLDEMKSFMDKLNKNFRYKSKPEFSILRQPLDKNEIKKYINWVLSEIMMKKTMAQTLSNTPLKIDEVGNLTFTSLTHSDIEKYNEIKDRLLSILNKLGFTKLNIKIEKCSNQKNIYETQEHEIARYLNKKTKTVKINNENKWINSNNNRSSNYEKVEINQLRTFDKTHVETKGKIFSINSFITKQGITIFSIEITDFKEAILLKKFARDDSDVKFFQTLKKNDTIKVRGMVAGDKYQNDISINIQQLTKINKKTQTNPIENTKKRVELSARSKMSVMDGITTTEKMYKRAKKLGYKAIAITDIDNIQSFPEYYQQTKDDPDFKAIFGCVFRVIEKNTKIISQNNDLTITKQKYVVFDLETTGFHAKYNGIIEFGACKIEDGKIVDKKPFFINPEQKINSTIEKLTGISDEDIKDAINEKQGLKEMIEYFGNHILIAHNAKFDMSFIYKKIEKYNLKPINNTVLDTLPLSRMMTPKFKRHSLKFMANRYGVTYDTDVAHRADYDAKVLAMTWIKMMEKLTIDNITSTKDLWDQNKSKSLLNQRGHLITLLAQTNQGLKNLFKLSSISHTTNFYNHPTLFKEDIEKHRNGILVGTGGIDGIVWNTELDKTQSELEKELQFYDYVEVNPISNLSHLIKRKDISLSNAQKAIENIINTSKLMKKTIVVTTEPRYIYEEESFIHKIYIQSKGLGGSSHSLFRYNEEEPEYPILSFKTTEQLIDEFQFLKDKNIIEEIIITNTNIIADSIDRVVVTKTKLYTPNIKGSKELLKQLVFNKAKLIYGEDLPLIIKDRMETELAAIISNGYEVIYWISHLLVKKSLESGFLVGSRGSVGSSLIATMAGITEVNPLIPHYYCKSCKNSEFRKNSKSRSGYDLPDKECDTCKIPLEKDGHEIPFETFLGFGGEKVPDIDLNFSGQYQPTIHNEVKKIFGEKHCFRAGTISTVAQKTAFGYAKAWTENNNSGFSKSFINYITSKLSGTKRTTGQHPGGIIIIPKEMDVEDFTPINYPANDVNASWKTTHFDFNSIHNNILKLDLLGHDDPTAIRMLQDFTNISPDEIPNSDPKVLSLFSSTKALGIDAKSISGETTGAMGIPEFGTPFVRGILKSVKVESFSDLISISGLSHGTDVWTNNAQQDVKNLGINIDEIISCRDDILNDLREYGMDGKKAFIIMEQVRKGRSITQEQEDEMNSLKVPNWYIESCKKIKYMFPKSHATAYVKMAWKVAWFKIYHPLPYYATYFAVRARAFNIEIMMNGKSKVHNELKTLKTKKRAKNNAVKITTKEKELIQTLELCEELYARGFKVISVDVLNSSSEKWQIDYEKKALIPPFNVIDGLGEIVAKSIVAERIKKEFSSIEDFKKRTGINKNSLQQLINIGSLKGMSEKNQLSLF